MKNNFYNFEYSSYNIFCPPTYIVRVVNRAVWSGYIERLEEEKNSFLQETMLEFDEQIERVITLLFGTGLENPVKIDPILIPTLCSTALT